MKKLAILGGNSIRTRLPNRKSMGQSEINAATRVLKSDVLSGFIGATPTKYFNEVREVIKFEKLWAETYGFKHAISVNS